MGLIQVQGPTLGPSAYRKNVIINGDMRVWQRGIALTSAPSSSRLADRFVLYHTTDGAFDLYQSGSFPAGFYDSLMVKVRTADATIAAGQYAMLAYNVEGYDFRQMIGRTVTLSFWARSNTAGTFCVGFRPGSTVTKSYVVEYTLGAENWEYKSFTLPVSEVGGDPNYTNGQAFQVVWALACGATFVTTKDAWQTGNFLATANQSNWAATTDNEFRITGVQLELGSVATPFEYRPYAEELALCKRYFQKGSPAYFKGYVVNGVVYGVNTRFSPQMRATPATITKTYISSLSFANTGETVESSSDEGFVLIHTANASSSGNYLYSWTADAEL
jgi:hypothetical protein